MSDEAGRPAAVRVLLAKPGLDGHDRGVKVVAMGLRAAGAEVIYLGLRRSAEEIVRAAADEGADVIGLSILSGAHLELSSEVMSARAAHGAEDIPVVVGGTVPEEDAAKLREMGIAAVFPVGTALHDVVRSIIALASAA